MEGLLARCFFPLLFSYLKGYDPVLAEQAHIVSLMLPCEALPHLEPLERLSLESHHWTWYSGTVCYILFLRNETWEFCLGQGRLSDTEMEGVYYGPCRGQEARV